MGNQGEFCQPREIHLYHLNILLIMDLPFAKRLKIDSRGKTQNEMQAWFYRKLDGSSSVSLVSLWLCVFSFLRETGRRGCVTLQDPFVGKEPNHPC